LIISLIEKSSQTAILIFSRSSKEESIAKRFNADHTVSERIAKLLFERTFTQASSSGLPLFILSSREQHGQTFGQRITNAVYDVFSKGFESVITVGTDCPDLSLEDINKTKDFLQSGRSVLGPDLRGGTYLFGITKSQFDARQFVSLPWQTSYLFEAFKQQLSDQCHHPCVELKRKFDLNSLVDVQINQRWSLSLSRILSEATNQLSTAYCKGDVETRFALQKILRGPPAVVSFI